MFECPMPRGRFGYPTTRTICIAYYIDCFDDEPTFGHRCPRGLFFNRHSMQCDQAHMVPECAHLPNARASLIAHVSIHPNCSTVVG